MSGNIDYDFDNFEDKGLEDSDNIILLLQDSIVELKNILITDSLEGEEINYIINPEQADRVDFLIHLITKEESKLSEQQIIDFNKYKELYSTVEISNELIKGDESINNFSEIEGSIKIDKNEETQKGFGFIGNDNMNGEEFSSIDISTEKEFHKDNIDDLDLGDDKEEKIDIKETLLKESFLENNSEVENNKDDDIKQKSIINNEDNEADNFGVNNYIEDSIYETMDISNLTNYDIKLIKGSKIFKAMIINNQILQEEYNKLSASFDLLKDKLTYIKKNKESLFSETKEKEVKNKKNKKNKTIKERVRSTKRETAKVKIFKKNK